MYFLFHYDTKHEVVTFFARFSSIIIIIFIKNIDSLFSKS